VQRTATCAGPAEAGESLPSGRLTQGHRYVGERDGRCVRIMAINCTVSPGRVTPRSVYRKASTGPGWSRP